MRTNSWARSPRTELFKPKPALIRFWILDANLHIHGLSDLAPTNDEFAGLSLSVERGIYD
jgi:hypothetical protein